MFCVLMILFPCFANADDKFDLNIRRIGLEWNKTQIKHAAEYKDSPESAFTATSQELIKGIFDTALEYAKDRLSWDNSLFMEYGKTTLRPYDDEKTVDESADKILYSSDLSYACWEWNGLKFGPTARAQYETEFVGHPHRNVLRPNLGLALFDHEIIKNLYITGVYEYDFTYSEHKVSKFATEAGWRLEYPVRDGVKFTTDGYYREYLAYSEYVPTDFERDFNSVVRLDTNLWGNFTMGPYFRYRRAKARGAEHYGSNTSLGISFNYINKIGLRDISD